MAKYVASGAKLRQEYFEWLCDFIGVYRSNASYWILTKALYDKEFMPGNIPHDDNRAEDGLYLREEFLVETRQMNNSFMNRNKCSFLEMLIALSRHMEFQLSSSDDYKDRTSRYFWELIKNLGLIIYDDDHFIELGGDSAVDKKIKNINYRQYFTDGEGGLFPLRHSQEDQRYVEIWYQMMAYIEEKYPV